MRKAFVLALAIALLYTVSSITASEIEKYSIVDREFSLIKPEDGGTGYYIPPGSTIYHEGPVHHGITTVYSLEGRVILKAKDSETPTIRTPFGTTQPVTYGLQVPPGTNSRYESFKLDTEDRGQIVTECAVVSYYGDIKPICALVFTDEEAVNYLLQEKRGTEKFMQ